MRNAIWNASIIALVPKSAAPMLSRTSPVTRDSSVNAETEIGTLLKTAVSAIEADPSGFYLKTLATLDIQRLAAAVPAARSVKTFRDTCGAFNLPLPPVGDAEGLNSTRERFNAYVRCLNANRTISPEGFPEMDYFMMVASSTRGIARFTCSRSRSAKCIPDLAYQRLSSITTSANQDLVSHARTKGDVFDRERKETMEELKYFKERLDARVSAHNADVSRRDAEDERRSYSAPSYTPSYEPPPTTYRRPSDTSARGIR